MRTYHLNDEWLPRIHLEILHMVRIFAEIEVLVLYITHILHLGLDKKKAQDYIQSFLKNQVMLSLLTFLT